MQTPPVADATPRYYHLILEPDLFGGWSLVREWGQQGRPGRVRREHFEDREAAEAAFMRVRDAQLGRGYRVVFAEGEGMGP